MEPGENGGTSSKPWKQPTPWCSGCKTPFKDDSKTDIFRQRSREFITGKTPIFLTENIRGSSSGFRERCVEPCDTWSDPCAVSCLREGSRGSARGHTLGGPGPAPSRPLQTRGLRRDPHLRPRNHPPAPSTAAPVPDPSAPGPWTPTGTVGHAPGPPAGHPLPPQGTGGRRWAPVLQAIPGQRGDVCSCVTQSLPNGLRQRLASQQERGAQHPRSYLHAAATAYGHATWTRPASLMVT